MSNKRRRFAARQKAAIVLEALKEKKSIAQIAEELRVEFGMARSTIQRYMREMGILALVPGPHTSKPAPEHPNHIWGIDSTYIRLAHG